MKSLILYFILFYNTINDDKAFEVYQKLYGKKKLNKLVGFTWDVLGI